MNDVEQRIYDEQARIKEAMLYAIERTTVNWNGEIPYGASWARNQLAESTRFKRIYSNFIEGKE
jgi:hypothetical protein